MTQAPVFKAVKVMGERATGTNFLALLIDANFDVAMVPNISNRSPGEAKLIARIPKQRRRPAQLRERIADHHHVAQMPECAGWKHACLTDTVFQRFRRANDTLFLCILRHPALWLVSFHKTPFADANDPAKDLSDFLATPWMTRARDEIDAALIPGPGHLWRLKAESYLDQAKRRANVRIVRHEDLLHNLAGVLDDLAEVLPRRSGDWSVPQGYSRPWIDSDSDFDSIRKSLPADPFATLSKPVSDELTSQIGAGLIRRTGYGDGS